MRILRKKNHKNVHLILLIFFKGDFGYGWKFDGIEPISIDDIIVDKGRGIYINAKNIQIFRGSFFNIDKIKVNVDNLNIDAIVDFKNVTTFLFSNLKFSQCEGKSR